MQAASWPPSPACKSNTLGTRCAKSRVRMLPAASFEELLLSMSQPVPAFHHLRVLPRPREAVGRPADLRASCGRVETL